MSFLQVLKGGNKSSLLAAVGNTFLAILKGFAAFISGSGAMFATTIHSIADATNQTFVFIGSALAERDPTSRFPTGFGRVVNLFVLVAVMVIAIMAYETLIKGWTYFRHPKPPENLLLNLSVLIVAVAVDGYVLWRTMKEIIIESRGNAKGLGVVSSSFRNVKYASPPTKLVFYEDIIASAGALLAFVAILTAQLTGLYFLDGVGTMLIAVLLIGIAIKIGYENTVGLIGVAAPKVVEERIAKLILSDPDVEDINKLRITQEGRQYHVESDLELRKGLSLAEADDIKYRVHDRILQDEDIDDVTLGIIETDDIKSWVLNPS